MAMSMHQSLDLSYPSAFEIADLECPLLLSRIVADQRRHGGEVGPQLPIGFLKLGEIFLVRNKPVLSQNLVRRLYASLRL
jgi:hypothetical protein